MTTIIDRPASSETSSKETTTVTTAAPSRFDAPAPVNHYEPLKIAEDTYVIRQLAGEGTPIQVYLNSLVILGREPVIVDTGTAANRRYWMHDVFGLIDPRDVRWVFLSHDDHDHTGNLVPVLEMCPNATLVTTWFQVERLVGDYSLPLERMRWVEDGGSFDAGDRKLFAIRPPIFDSPTTRGLFDPKTGVYWGSDCFATPVAGATENYSDLDPQMRRGGVQTFASAVSPWTHLADAKKYAAQVDRIAALEIDVAAGGHSPVLHASDIREVLDILRGLPESEPAVLPGQEALNAMLAAMGVVPAAA